MIAKSVLASAGRWLAAPVGTNPTWQFIANGFNRNKAGVSFSRGTIAGIAGYTLLFYLINKSGFLAAPDNAINLFSHPSDWIPCLRGKPTQSDYVCPYYEKAALDPQYGRLDGFRDEARLATGAAFVLGGTLVSLNEYRSLIEQVAPPGGGPAPTQIGWRRAIGWQLGYLAMYSFFRGGSDATGMNELGDSFDPIRSFNSDLFTGDVASRLLYAPYLTRTGLVASNANNVIYARMSQASVGARNAYKAGIFGIGAALCAYGVARDDTLITVTGGGIAALGLLSSFRPTNPADVISGPTEVRSKVVTFTAAERLAIKEGTVAWGAGKLVWSAALLLGGGYLLYRGIKSAWEIAQDKGEAKDYGWIAAGATTLAFAAEAVFGKRKLLQKLLGVAVTFFRSQRIGVYANEALINGTISAGGKFIMRSVQGYSDQPAVLLQTSLSAYGTPYPNRISYQVRGAYTPASVSQFGFFLPGQLTTFGLLDAMAQTQATGAKNYEHAARRWATDEVGSVERTDHFREMERIETFVSRKAVLEKGEESVYQKQLADIQGSKRKYRVF